MTQIYVNENHLSDSDSSRVMVAWDFWGVLNTDTDAELAGVLQSIMNMGGMHTIVSHSSSYEIESFLDTHSLRQFFVQIYGAEWHVGDAMLGKTPALQDFIARFGPFSYSLMVGDSLADIEDGKRAGMRTCLYDKKGFYHNTEHGADFIVDRLTEIPDLLEKSK